MSKKKKNETPIITRLIKLEIQGDKKQKREIFDYVRKVIQQTAILANAVSSFYADTFRAIKMEMDEKKISKAAVMKDMQDRIGVTIQTLGYKQMGKEQYEEFIVASSIYSTLNIQLYTTLFDKFYKIVYAHESTPSFTKSNMAIPFKAVHTGTNGLPPDSMKVEEDDVFVKFPLKRGVDIGDTWMKLIFGKDKSNNRSIVNKIMSSEYKMADSKFMIRNNELYLLLSVRIPRKEDVKLDPDRIMGIDIGIRRPATVYITNCDDQPRHIAMGEKIAHERIRFDNDRRRAQKNAKYNRGGHGRKRKTELRTSLKEREKNWAKNMNHEISKEIVNIAQRFGVGVIKMEQLKGIAKDKKFLRKWAYHQLQTFIKYKAEMVGIKVLKVNPYNTSATCFECKQVDEKSRVQDVFNCTNPFCKNHGKNKDADINAAMNIAHKEPIEDKVWDKMVEEEVLTEE